MRPTTLGTGALLAGVCVAAGFAGVAVAQERMVEHPFDGFIGGTVGSLGGQFDEPSDVAVFQGNRRDPRDDKIFVVEGIRDGSSRVQRLDSDGNFELMWGRDVVRAGLPGDRGRRLEVCTAARDCQAGRPGGGAGELDAPTGVAVDPVSGAVYVADGGNRRIQKFDSRGRVLTAWDWRGRSGSGGIAVRPDRTRDVFVTDEANRRVLQFRSSGQLVRAWDLGVGAGVPRHIVVARGGVVFVSASSTSDRIVRFDADLAPGPDGRPAPRLAPISTEQGDLTGGSSFGLDLDPRTGELLVLRNPFGPSVIDVIAKPTGSGRDGPRRRVSLSPTVYVESMSGMAVGRDGLVFVAKGRRLNESDPAVGFDGCTTARSRSPACHGLMVLAVPPGRDAVAVMSPVRVSSTSAVLPVKAQLFGAFRWHLEISSDGVVWRRAGPTRYVTGAGDRAFVASVRRLATGTAYLARAITTRRSALDAPRTYVSAPVYLVTRSK